MKIAHYISFLIALITLFSCESEIDIDLPEREPEVVVEGYIEAGSPPVVLLTKTETFFSTVELESLEDLFIHDATVIVSSNGITDTLFEVQTDSVLAFIEFAEDSLGIELDLTLFEEFDVINFAEGEFNFSFYTSVNLLGLINNRYDLIIETEDKVLTSTTTIPRQTPLDFIFMTPHPDPDEDSLFSLNGHFTDVPGERNNIRYFTQFNREPFYPAFFNSVLSDGTWINADGESFSFSMEKGFPRTEPIDDFDELQYFKKGDTVRVRWSAIDTPHFEFWSSLEFDRTQTGNPFGRPTVISTNINGGLGIWGGYSSTFHQIIVE